MIRGTLFLAVALALIAGGCGSSGAEGIEVMRRPPDTLYTYILEGGTLYDGLGNRAIETDIGIVGDRILAFGDLAGYRTEQRIDVTGLTVTPGFIDMHSHAASSSIQGSDLFQEPLAENYIRQGVTTAIAGQDGSSPYPIGPFLKEVDRRPAAVNLGLTVGHGTIRAFVMGNVDRKPSPTELSRMEGMVKTAMADGAYGLSSGLEYTPGAFAKTDELIALAKAASPYGGIYTSHMRDEGGKLLESVAETIRIGEEGGLAPHVTHHKVIGKARWGLSKESLALIDEARARGVDAASDVYPYTASSTGISILLPAWARQGSAEQQRARLRDPEQRVFIRNDVVEHIRTERGADPSTIVIASCSWNRSLNGKSLSDILVERDKEVTLENAADLAIELQEKGGCVGVFHSMSEEDVERILAHPTTMVASDGGIPSPGAGVPHPRNYGTFARVLARYVRELDVISLREAIHKMSGQPAQRLGLVDRGVLREGAFADVAVFDPALVQDLATFSEPHQYAAGMVHVFVNGQPVLLDGEMTGKRPGRALRHAPKQAAPAD
ncbi:MAG: D-aminoacylase [Rhodothermales bacterium]